MKNTSQNADGRNPAQSPSGSNGHAPQHNECIPRVNVPRNPPVGALASENLIPVINNLLGDQCASPARRIVTGSGRRLRGKFASRRFGITLCWESQLERAFIHQMQLSRRITGVHAQPARLRLPTPDGVLDYTPDFLVNGTHEEFIFVECKPRSKLTDIALAKRLHSIKTVLEAAGAQFVVLCEDHLLDKTLQANVAQLLSFVCPRQLDQRWLSQLAVDIGKLQPRNLCDLALEFGYRSAMIALANGLLCTNLRERLDGSSVLLLPDSGGCDVADYL